MSLITGIFLGMVLFLISFFSDHLYIKTKRPRMQARSFVGGVMMTYIFLELIPQSIPTGTERNIFFAFILIGFSLFHVLEKYIYQHARGVKLRRELKEEHLVLFVAYHFVIGLILMSLIRNNAIEGVLFFIPVVLHDLLSSTSVHHLYGPINKKVNLRSLISFSSLVGIAFAYYFPLNDIIVRAMIALIAGILTHQVVRDTIPDHRDGEPAYFIWGVLTMVGFLMLRILAN